MADSKNPFGNLFEVKSEDTFKSKKVEGNLVFGSWKDSNNASVYKIWANHIEYNIADASAYAKLIEDLSTYVHGTVDTSVNALEAWEKVVDASIAAINKKDEDQDSSIDRLDSSVSALETWKAAMAIEVADNKVSIEGVDGDVTFTGSDYVKVSTVDGSINISIDGSVQKGTGAHAADTKLATVGYVEEAIDEAEGDVNDLSTYVHTTVDGSISDISSRLSSASTRLDEVSTRLNDLSTYVYTKVDASIDRLDTSVNLLDASVLKGFQNDDRQDASIGLLDSSVLAAFQRNDVEDASINAIDGSLANLYKVVDSSFKAVDASLKAALKDVSISAIATGNVATITLGKTTEGDVTTTDSYTVTGDSYIVLDQTENDKLTISLKAANTKKLIADASGADSSVATAYAVKEYVKDQISTLESALEFKDEITSSDDAVAKLTTAATSKGDTWVYSGTDTITYDNQKIEHGDLIIVKADTAAGEASSIIVIEHSQTGIVTNGTAEGGELTADRLVLGNGNDSIKTTEYGIGTNVSTEIGDSSVATEKFVDAYVKAAVVVEDASMKKYVNDQDVAYDSSLETLISDTSKGINARIDAISLTADSSTINYLKIAASEDTTDQFNVEAGVVVVDLSTASAKGQGLADAYDVKQAIAAAGGTLSADAAKDNKSDIKLTAADGGSLGDVSVAAGDYIKLTGAANKIQLDLSTATLADASNGIHGLALAEDVNAELVANEQVVAASFNKLQETLGLDSDLTTSTEFVNTFGDVTISQAAIDLSNNLKASIEALDVNPTYEANKVLVSVSETDGKVSSLAAGLQINGVDFASDGSTLLKATIDGDDIKVGQHEGDDATWAAKTIAEAIVDLSTAIDNVTTDAIKEVKGENEQELKNENGDYVKVSATENPAGTVTLDSSVQLADSSSRVDGGAAFTATGLATDAYVRTAIANELAWNVLD